MVGTARIWRAAGPRREAGGAYRQQPPTFGLKRHLTLYVSRLMLPVFVAVLLSGCGEPQVYVPPPPRQVVRRTEPVEPPATIPAGFAPTKINILPLTELNGSSTGGQNATLKVYVALLDEFGSPIKTPGVLRFELYEHIQRSAQAKGQRIAIWSDFDLTHPARNNEHWRDFLRAYEFSLDTSASRDRPYILEVTHLCPDGRRLSGEFMLKP